MDSILFWFLFLFMLLTGLKFLGFKFYQTLWSKLKPLLSFCCGFQKMLSISCKVCLHIHDLSLDLFLLGKGVIFIDCDLFCSSLVNNRLPKYIFQCYGFPLPAPSGRLQIFLSSYNCYESGTRVDALYWDKLSLFIYLC